MRRRGGWLTSLALAAGVAGCRGAVSVPEDPPLLSLGEQEVRRSEFEAYVAALEARDGPLPAGVRANLMESWLEERALVLEARARGLLDGPATPEEEQAAVQQLLAEVVLPGIQVGDDEVAAFYATHGEELRSPETVTLRQILVPTLNEARDVTRRLYKDRRSFELLARTRSRAPEASTGGQMGTFERGQLPPELEQAAFATAPGKIAPIVETPLGFHVLRVDARTEARDRELEECRDEIRSRLLKAAYDAAVRRYIAGLMARAEVNHDVVQSGTAALP